MDKKLLEAATSGNSILMQARANVDVNILLGTTPAGNTCLHIASTHGYQEFCMNVVALQMQLLAEVNLDGETPLLAAVKSGHVSLALDLLGLYNTEQLSAAILTTDTTGSNALHHAIRSGHRSLALQLIHVEPALSKQVNNQDESPMYMAAMRDFTKVASRLLQINGSAHSGPCGYNALHATARNGNSGLAKRIMNKRREMATEANKGGNTPLSAALYRGQIDVVRVLLEHDRSLGYEAPHNNKPLLSQAASGGHIDVAQVLLEHCPDAPYRSSLRLHPTSLHESVFNDHVEFVEFIVKTPQLRKLINMQDVDGKTALHVALQKCNPKMVAAFLSHQDIDTTVLDRRGNAAAWELLYVDHPKTLNWNEVSMRMLRADPQDATSLHNLHTRTKQKAIIEEARKEAKSLTQTYTSNTSLVAILMTMITFAAAFTLPGGYSSAHESEGLPIMSRKVAFKVFLISDTLAMCSSFVVAFICIIARWEDYEFLVYYRSFTKKLMWFAYAATTTAFSTGLYTVHAPRVPWLAIAVCVLVALLPILTKLLGEWPVLKIRLRLRKSFNSEFLSMV